MSKIMYVKGTRAVVYTHTLTYTLIDCFSPSQLQSFLQLLGATIKTDLAVGNTVTMEYGIIKHG